MEKSSRLRRLWGKYKWIIPASFIASLVFSLTAIALCRVRGFDGMESYAVFNIGADIVSLCICTVLLYSLAQDKDGFSAYTVTFAMLIFFTAALLFSDAAWWVVEGISGLRLWNLLINVFRFIVTTMLIFYFWRYVVTALRLDGAYRRIADIIMYVLLIPAVLACFANLFVPLYFSISDDGVYFREPLFLWSQAYFGIGLVIATIGFFVSEVPVKDRLIAASFVLIPVFNQIITLYSFELSTEYCAMLISIVLVFGVLVTKREKEHIAMEKELYEARVNVMVSQIQPHFMYNALTSIAMMCRIDPDTAQEATVTFAKYLRGNMDSLRQSSPVAFEQELEHLKKYLYIEKLRFGDMLNIEYDITATDFRLPLLSIQPLVENAVKHGVGMAEDGGTVKISTRETETAFEVIISDDGLGFDVSAPIKDDGRTHVGMDNTKRRIKEMCGGEIKIESAVGKGTTATVILPKEGQNFEDTVS